MPGIFDAKITGGSNLQGESFVKPPTQVVSSNAVGSLAESAVNLYGLVQANKAARQIGAAQDDFLNNLDAARQEVNEIEKLKQQGASSTEQVVFDDAQKQIRTLEDSINSRRINPAEAQARIENIKRKAIARAPFFASRIKALSGPRGEVFEAETNQLIKERNQLREEVVEAGLNPDNLAHLDFIRQSKATQAELDFLTAEGQLNTIKGDQTITNMINNVIGIQEASIQNTIQEAGGLDNLNVEQSTELINQLQTFQNGAESVIVRNLIDANPNLNYSIILKNNPKLIEKAEQQVRGAAETLQKQITGEIPKGISENRLSYLKDSAMIQLEQDNPLLFSAIIQMGNIQDSTIGGFAANQSLALGMLNYLKARGLNDINGVTKSGLAASGVENPDLVQKQIGRNIEDGMNFIINNPNKVDPNFVRGHLENMNFQLEAMTEKPQEFNPELFDSMLRNLSSPELMNQMTKINPSEVEVFKTRGREMMTSYVTEKMVPSINRALGKRITTDAFGGVGRRAAVRDLVSVTVGEDGILNFIPNTGFQTVRDERKAASLADDLNKRFSGRSSAVLRAGKNIGGLSDGLEKELSLRLFQDALADIDEAPVTEATTIKPRKKDDFSTLQPILSRDR